MNEKNFDLNVRLIDFAADCIRITETLPPTFAGNHIGGQLVRSGTAPALQYGEAQGAESAADFVHKMKVALKELKETFNGLRIIRKMEWCELDPLNRAIQENSELNAIFIKSIDTARKNLAKRNTKSNKDLNN